MIYAVFRSLLSSITYKVIKIRVDLLVTMFVCKLELKWILLPLKNKMFPFITLTLGQIC